ncbi:MAG: Mov34/MPN/PAD-1 family protein [Candidatus Hydrothermarchaeales archaeon]
MIVLGEEILQQLEEHARREEPKEACGILVGIKGEDKIVKKAYQCKNVDEHPETNYRIDAGDQIRIFEEIEEGEFELIGFYHSHPMGLHAPSSIDTGRATWPGYSYVIVSLSDGVTFSSWVWSEDEGKFIEESLKESTE